MDKTYCPIRTGFDSIFLECTHQCPFYFKDKIRRADSVWEIGGIPMFSITNECTNPFCSTTFESRKATLAELEENGIHLNEYCRSHYE